MSKLDIYASSLAGFLIRFRWLVVILTVAFVMTVASGARFIGFDTDYRVFFSDDNPQLVAFDNLQEVYTKTDNVLYVLKPKSGDVFTADVLRAVKELTTGGWQLPYSTRVDSLTNYQHTYAEEDDLTVIDLVEQDPDTLSEDDFEYIRNVALNEPLLVRRIVSPDGGATGVNITFYLPGKSPMEEVPNATARARELLKTVQAKHPNIEIRASGMIYMNNTFSESSQKDMQTLVPLMYLILIVGMLVLLRCIASTIATVFVIAFSAMFAMGMTGWLGIHLTPPSATAPTIILTLAIADSIHIIMSMMKGMQSGMNRNEAIVESIRINFQPVFLTSVTTAIGFLSLNFSDAPPFRDLGNITAMGVMAAFVFSVFFLPALLSILPVRCGSKKSIENGGKSSAMDKWSDFVIGNYKKIFVIMVVIVGILGSMVPKIELNDEFVEYFDYSIPFRGDTEFMIDNLTGIYNIEYSLGAKDEQGVSDPVYLENMEKFANWLRKQPEVMHVYSMTDVFKRLNKNMHGDNPDWYKLPENRELAAQYLLLYEFSLPYGLDLNDRMNVDKSASRLTATLYNLSTVETRGFKDRSVAWLKENTPEYMHVNGTSPIIMFSYISERNIESMTRGNVVALVLISFIIMIALRSVRIGFISLVPNLVPAIMGFGVWAILVGQVNMAAAIVAAVSLGIIVDDTVHFLSKYYRARRERGLDAKDAVRYAFSTVGPALIVTTIVLIAGFFVLTFSGFLLNSTLGLITAITIACALIADFLLLPALLIMIDKKKETL